MTAGPFAGARAGAFAKAAAAIRPLDQTAARAAAERHDRLTKPRGSLGRLEDLGIQLAAIAGEVPPPVPAPAAVAVFAADHGVVAEGVTPWPKEVTAQMVANFLAGGAAISVLARRFGARVLVVDVGVDADLVPAPGLWPAKVRRGTANLAVGPAMTPEEVEWSLDVGASVAADLAGDGAACLVTGEMGIGNTTPAATLIGALTGQGAAAVTGRGTGVDDATLARKVGVVERALARVAAAGIDPADPRALLSQIGGLEIAALAGFVVGGAAARLPVVGDGVIALAAIAVAEAIAPGVRASCIAGHRSTEPGATIALRHLGLEPVLDLGMRLGEGSGACLALPVLDAAALVLAEMATFDEAGVVTKDG